VLEVAKRREAGIYDHVDAPAAAAVTTIGTAARHMCLAAHRRGAVAAAARRDMELDDVEEHALRQELRGIVED
jgi:hypothetical protein